MVVPSKVLAVGQYRLCFAAWRNPSPALIIRAPNHRISIVRNESGSIAVVRELHVGIGDCEKEKKFSTYLIDSNLVLSGPKAMAFCDALLWSHLFQAVSDRVKGDGLTIGPQNERQAVSSLLENDGIGEEWKSVALSASWSFWKDLTKPHNKVRYLFHRDARPLLPLQAAKMGQKEFSHTFSRTPASISLFKGAPKKFLTHLLASNSPLSPVSLGRDENSRLCKTLAGDGTL